jgi:hypothetical protein
VARALRQASCFLFLVSQMLLGSCHFHMKRVSTHDQK